MPGIHIDRDYYSRFPYMRQSVPERITDMGTKVVNSVISKTCTLAMAILISSGSQAGSEQLHIMTGCSKFIDTDGGISAICDSDDGSNESIFTSEEKQELLTKWYYENLDFNGVNDFIVAAILESPEFPDSFYMNAKKILEDPNYDTLHFQLLGDVYRNAPVYHESTPDQQEAFNTVRDELLEHTGYLGLIDIPNPGGI